MAKTPLKIYYDIQQKDAMQVDLNPIPSANDYPGIKIGQKDFLVNIQLYDGDVDTKFQGLPATATAQWFTDNDYSNPLYTDFSVGSSNWTLSGSGTGEYYYSATITEPDSIIELITVFAPGTVGSLAVGEWDYGDNDAIGESRVYVRLTDSTDPDLLASGILRYVAGGGSYTKLFLQSFADKFNQSSSWWDEDTLTYRNPVITDGEISFYLDSTTDDYAARLGNVSGLTTTFTEVQFIENGTDDIFQIFKFQFNCLNRLLANAIPTTPTGNPSYSKTESDARYVQKVSSTQVTLTDDSTNYIILGSSSAYNSIYLSGSIYNGTDTQFFDGYVNSGNGSTAEAYIATSDHPAVLSGVSYGADISGGNMRLSITLTAVGGTIKSNYIIHKYVIRAT